jgi:methylmalonyl-CoA/ethylmalonyl-CoA epimerase
MVKSIFSINIAVRDLPAATKRYQDFFGVTAEQRGPERFAFPGLRGVRLTVGGMRLNLITPEQPGTNVGRFLDKHGEGVFLVSAEVEDMQAQLDTLGGLGIKPLLPESAAGAWGVVNFIHPREMNGVQFELIQPAV